MKPPTGHYRKLLQDTYPDVRIAFTHTPIIGCRQIDSEPIIQELRKSDDEYAPYYINILQNGSAVPIVEKAIYERTYKNNGELFFTT